MAFSSFLEWYYFEIYNGEGEIIVSWSYNPMFEWRSAYEEDFGLNSVLKPVDLLVPISLFVALFAGLIACGIGVVFKDVEGKEDLDGYSNFSYANIFVLALNLYFVVVFPIMYLLPNGLYFPFLTLQRESPELTYYYVIGPGYILQVIAFALIFPYIVFYHRTILRFESKNTSAERIVSSVADEIDSSVDFKKLYAEEFAIMQSQKEKVENKKNKNNNPTEGKNLRKLNPR